MYVRQPHIVVRAAQANPYHSDSRVSLTWVRMPGWLLGLVRLAAIQAGLVNSFMQSAQVSRQWPNSVVREKR